MGERHEGAAAGDFLRLNPAMIYGAVAIIFVIVHWVWLVEGHVLYGGMISWQHMPATIAYYDALHAGRYPFFFWDLGIGFGSLADSQQHMLQPVKLLLAFLLPSPYRIDTYLMVLHIALLVYATIRATLYFLGDSVSSPTRHLLAAYAGVTIMLSVGVASDYMHTYFVCTLPYFVLLLPAVDRCLKKPSRGAVAWVVLWTLLMLLVGNFAQQFVDMQALTLFAGLRIYFGRLPLRAAVPVIVGFALAAILALPQLIPTYEVMRISVRSAPGGFDKFLVSATPLQFLSYLAPGGPYLVYKYAHFPYVKWSGNNVAESIHYVGVLPLALFIYFLARHKTFGQYQKIFSVGIVYLFLRAAGIFFVVNVLLNYLPVFGQFRAPVRHFLAADVLLLLMAVSVLPTVLDRVLLRRILGAVMIAIATVTISCLAVAVGWQLYENGRLPDFTFYEVVYPLFGILFAAAARLLLASESPLLAGQRIVLPLVLLGLLDVAAQHTGVVDYWRHVSASTLEAQAAKVDTQCRAAGARKLWMDFTWPDFDLPVFPFTDSRGEFYTNRAQEDAPELNGRNCVLTYSLATSTLTPDANVDLYNWLMALAPAQRRSLLPLLGFEDYVPLTPLVGHAPVAEELAIARAPLPDATTVTAFREFIDEEPAAKPPVFARLTGPLYRFLVETGLDGRLPSTVRDVQEVAGIGKFVALEPPDYYIFVSGGKSVEPTRRVGSLVLLPPNAAGSVRIIFVPVDFAVGMGGLVAGLLLCLVLLAFRPLPVQPRPVRWHDVAADYGRRIAAVLAQIARTRWVILGAFVFSFGVIGGGAAFGDAAHSATLIFFIVFTFIAYLVARLLSRDRRLAAGSAALVLALLSVSMTLLMLQKLRVNAQFRSQIEHLIERVER